MHFPCSSVLVLWLIRIEFELGCKKEGNLTFYDSIYGPGDYHAT